MDLGTIKSQLLSGKYAELAEKHTSDKFHSLSKWDRVITLLLIDLEQIWHNCFTFNVEGSAVYRMADVQRLQHNRIQKVSFDADLSPNVKDIVETFICVNESKRKEMSTVTTLIPYANRLPPFIKMASNDVLEPKPGCLHIERKATAQAASRSVVVVDPETNTIFRYYTTQRMAMQACNILIDMGHDPGMTPYSDQQSGRDDGTRYMLQFRYILGLFICSKTFEGAIALNTGIIVWLSI